MLKKTPNLADRPVVETVAISAPRIEMIQFQIRGTSPYMQARLSSKTRQELWTRMTTEASSTKKRKRDPLDELADMDGATHYSRNREWIGIPASAFRAGMISACRLVNFKMTLARLSVFVEADGFDELDSTPLIRIEGEPEMSKMAVRNSSGVIDIRVRPLWQPGWTASPRIRFDRDQFSPTDVFNLLARMGAQVGIGEGRPDSRDSAGLGFGTFELL